VVATDILAGTEVVLSSGPAVEALLASASIPPVFPPVRIGGRFLVDGGLSNHTPVSTAVALGATRVMVLPTGFGCAVERPPRGAVAMALHALNLLIARQLVLDIERFHDAVELVVLPPLCPVAIFPYDFAHTGELIDRAEVATRNWIARGGLTKSRVPGSLRLHDHGGERLAPAQENRGDGPPVGECASPVAVEGG
jgi:NTE family protein